MEIFRGSGAAVITPFKDDLSVNHEAYGEIIEFLLKNETDAIISCGTTGEASTLSDDEQIETIKTAVAVTNKKVPVIAGTGSNDTAHGIKLCKRAQAVGADACLIVTPYYNKTTQKGLIAYFTTLAASIDIPVIMYNVPSRTGLNISPKTVYELSKVDNIVGIKEASGNLNQIAEIRELCGDSMDIYSGNDNEIVPILSLGGKGVISVVANIAPKNTHDLVMKFLNGDTKGSLDLQIGMLGLVRALFCEVNPIPVKAAMNLMGMKAGGYREPLIDMEPANFEFLKKEMVKYGLI